MNKILTLTILTFLSLSCEKVSNQINKTTATSCTLEKQGSNSKLTCPDGTHTTITNGLDGSSCHVTQNSLGAQMTCDSGESAFISNGKGCSVSPTINGALITCGSTTTLLYNGEDGISSPLNVAAIIDPCGNGPGFDEILLQLNDGSIIAYMEVAGNRFLSVLEPGAFITTDEQKCSFSIDGNDQVLW